MVVYQDNIPALAWLACDCCSFRGNQLHLAARVLNMAEEAVVVRLATLLGDRLGQYEANRQSEAWQKELNKRNSLDDLLADPVRGRAHTAAGVQYWPSGVSWQAQAAALVGWYSRKAVEDIVGPIGRAFEASIKEVAVAPLYGPPGRVEALWIWAETRQGNREVIRPLLGQRLPACLLCRQGLDNAPPGKQTFLFGRVRDALYLQVRQLAAGEALLPLAGTDLAAADLSSVLRPGRDLVLWTSGVPDERLLRQARVLQARVARNRIEHENLSLYLSRKRLSAVEFLDGLASGARDWRSSLEAAVHGMPESRVLAFLSGVGLSPSEIDEFARDLPGELGDSLRRSAEVVVRARPVVLGGRSIEETEEGWINSTGARISSAVLRIEEVVRLGQRNLTYYRGKVRSSGVYHPFEVAAAELDDQPAVWLDRFLTSKGDVLIHDPGWGRRLATLARHFHKPVVVEACDQVGWDNLNRSFRFPRWTLFDGGTVAPCTTRAPAAVRYPYDPEAPSSQRLESRELPRPALAVLLGLALDLVLPALGGRTSGLQVGTRSEQLLSVLEQLGIPGDSSLVQVCDPVAALAAGAAGGKHVVVLPEETDSDNPAEMPLLELAGIVPAYLSDLASRRFRLRPRQSVGRLTALREDMTDWARRHGVVPRQVREIFEQVLRLDGSRTAALRCFAELLAHLLIEGELSVVPERFYDPAENRLVLLDRGRLWLPTDTIDRVLQAGDRIAIGHERMTKLLFSCQDTAGMLETVRGRRGVSVVESWWTKNVRRSSQAEAV